jgi:Caspase domain
MKRKAILIESSKVNGYRDLPGARVDVENWKNFLQSDLGGLWAASEIVTLSHPYSADVALELKVDSDCYCFVAFSGHGAEGVIALNDAYKEFPITKLKPSVEKATVIIDSCRGISETQNFSFGKKAVVIMANESTGAHVALNALKGHATQFASADTIYNRATRAATRSATWEFALKNSVNGIVEMFSCAKGQEADEDPLAGGFYTSLLLQSAENWQKLSTGGKIHTTKEAHDYAAPLLPPQQTPEYRPSWLAFPFAVKV